MISVENFYWVLHEILIKHANIDTWLYYPYGTTNYLSRTSQFDLRSEPKQRHHVLFHFDQEPLWDDNLGAPYEALNGDEIYTVKTLRILANSEHSAIKKKICTRRLMLDWYFFYHGFAALCWYRDCQYVDEIANVSSTYLSLNHLTRGKRAYRMALLARLCQLDLLTNGRISCYANKTDLSDEIRSEKGYLSDRDRQLIAEQMPNLPTLPLTVDNVVSDGALSAQLGRSEYKMWQSSFLHLVNETVFFDPKLHLTEKIFKPIVALRPFILVAAPGNLAYLRSYGFQTFAPWIDESYDDVQDHDQRLDMIAAEIQKLSAKGLIELKRMQQDMQPVLRHNKKHFFGKFRGIIVNELVENFDTCLRVWNNGRVDERELPFVIDVAQVKRLLSS